MSCLAVWNWKWSHQRYIRVLDWKLKSYHLRRKCLNEILNLFLRDFTHIDCEDSELAQWLLMGQVAVVLQLTPEHCTEPKRHSSRLPLVDQDIKVCFHFFPVPATKLMSNDVQSDQKSSTLIGEQLSISKTSNGRKFSWRNSNWKQCCMFLRKNGIRENYSILRYCPKSSSIGAFGSLFAMRRCLWQITGGRWKPHWRHKPPMVYLDDTIAVRRELSADAKVWNVFNFVSDYETNRGFRRQSDGVTF